MTEETFGNTAHPTPRFCYHADESFVDKNHGGNAYIIVRIVEGEPGYYSMHESLSFPAVKDAETMATAMNERLGLSADDVLAIRASSMAAHFGEEN